VFLRNFNFNRILIEKNQIKLKSLEPFRISAAKIFGSSAESIAKTRDNAKEKRERNGRRV